MQFKFPENPAPLRKSDHVEGKTLEDVVFPEVVGLGKRAPIDWSPSKSEMKRFLTMGGCDIRKFPQTAASQELPEHKDKHMASVGGSPFLCPIAGLFHKAFEVSLRQKVGYLREYVLSDMHICSKFDVDAKVRISKVRQGSCDLYLCA